ncbi:hypothetical protein [Longimicrobium sp.]|uniref:hypothetical protein n=1 Tax=Longimicrobium sp. TaxID=2029185 RepID=UPI002E3723D7|nr:hypothetical protein [Longimicrobium sp.]HEX6036863.1 hypothetical protein [Longimicrobium sp.]
MSISRVRFSPANLAAGLIKLVLAGIVVVALVPQLRTRAMPHVAFAVDPIRRATTQDRVNSVSGYVEYESRITGHAPQDRDLPRVMARMFPGRKDAMMDPWGRRYYIRRRGDGFHVGSAGPDQRRDTPDDVLSSKRALPTPHGSAPQH